ncbi:MAG: hypothetical protein LBC33_02710, partial [Mycoplasmataceae bacterium]|nr:hypothetical protein [Mycoplasmataceae bacterium]
MIKNTFNRATLIWSIIAVFLLTGGGVGTFFIVNANKSTTSFITDTVITTSTNDLNVVYGNTKTITYHASEKGQWHFTTDATNFLDYSIDENNDLTVVLSASANVGQYPYTVSFSPPPEKYAFNPETIDAVITVLTSDAIKIVQGSNVVNEQIFGAETKNTYTIEKDQQQLTGGTWSLSPKFTNIDCDPQNGTITYGTNLAVGVYNFAIQCVYNPNYVIAELPIEFAVNLATPVIGIEGDNFTISKVYGASTSKKFNSSVPSGKWTIIANPHADITLNEDNGDLTAKATLPVGEYPFTVNYLINEANPDYRDATIHCMVIVQSGTTTINTQGNDFTITKVYGGDVSKTFTGSVSGGTFSLTGNTNNDISITQGGVLTAKATLPVGEYTASIKYALNNYTDATATCTIVVQPGTTAINTANNDFTITKVYGAPAASRTFTGSVSGGTFSLTNNPHNDIAITQAGVLSVKATVPVGNYSANIKYTLANYTDATKTCTIVVQPGTTTINTANNDFTITKVYGAPAASRTFTGSVSGGTFSLTGNTNNDISITQGGVLTAKATLPVGEYTASIKYALNN